MKDLLGKNCEKLKNKKLWLLDLDGTIYKGNNIFNGITTFLKNITINNGKYVFITNNPSKSVDDYILKLSHMNIKTNEDNFFTSAQATAKILKEKFGNSKIYVQGTASFIKGLRKDGLNVTEKNEDDIKCVLVSFDTEINFEKINNTCKALLKDIPFYSTNADLSCPTEYGSVPDCGSYCIGLQNATGKISEVIGKPKPFMINMVLNKFNVSKNDAVIVGDLLYTDIACGNNAGIDSILVLTGNSTMKDINENSAKPTYILNKLTDLEL